MFTIKNLLISYLQFQNFHLNQYFIQEKIEANVTVTYGKKDEVKKKTVFLGAQFHSLK